MPGEPRGLWRQYVVPRLVHGACSLRVITEQRRRIVPEAEGVVLEVGIGSGLNLPHYDAAKVRRVIGIDPDPRLLAMSETRRRAAPFEVQVIEAGAEAMPLEDDLADTALVTYTMCSIAEVARALEEVRRVLKPSGRLLFCEHGRSDRPSTAKWQDRLNPLWRAVAGGCNLNRDVTRLVEDAGFEIAFLDNYTLPGTPGLLGFQYLGSARPR